MKLQRHMLKLLIYVMVGIAWTTTYPTKNQDNHRILNANRENALENNTNGDIISIRITSSVAVERGKNKEYHFKDGPDKIDQVHLSTRLTAVTDKVKRFTDEDIYKVSASEVHSVTSIPPALAGANIEFIKQLRSKKEGKSLHIDEHVHPFQLALQKQNNVTHADSETQESVQSSIGIHEDDNFHEFGESAARGRSIPHSSYVNTFSIKHMKHNKINVTSALKPNSTKTSVSFNILHDAPQLPQVYSEPAKVYSEPAKVYSQPAKVYEKPESIYSEPAKVYSEPAKFYGNPESMYSEPAKVYSEPAKVYGKPESIYSEPAKVYSEPSKVYGKPELIYSEPAQVYSEPAKVYGKPELFYSEPAKIYGEPAKIYSEVAKVYGEPAKIYSEPAKVYSEPAKFYSEPASLHLDKNSTKDDQEHDKEQLEQLEITTRRGTKEMLQIALPSTEPTKKQSEMHQQREHLQEENYEVDESISVMTNGRTHGVQETTTDHNKVGYVVEGNDYRKYRVEERTSDGFIVGEYGVVSHNDGSLRGVRYTADGDTNPRLIYDALMKFLHLTR